MALLALDLYLLSPLLVERIWLRESDTPASVVLFSATASLLWLALLHCVFRRPAVMHLVLLPFHLVVAADLFTIVHYGTRLTSSVLSVLLENAHGTSEFLIAHGAAITAMLVPATVFYVACMHRIRAMEGPRRTRLGIAIASGLASLYGGFFVPCGDLVHLAAADRDAPFGVLPQGWLAWKVYRDLDAESAGAFRFHARRSEDAGVPETYVLVIGESARPDHFGLYGYERETTPRLSRQSNLIVFRDVVTQASYTSASVPLLLTRGSIADPERARGERSILALFAEIGFDTRWLSTQQREPYAVAINRCSADAREQHFAEGQHDGALVGMLEAALATSGSKRFFVIHTTGSHFAYASRFPAESARFRAADSTHRSSLVSDYDNSVLYTDQVLSELVSVLSAAPGIKALLYVADHGENLRDDDRDLFGHYTSNEYDLPIPMLLWYSDELARRWPEKVDAARRASAMRASTRSVFYTLADLGGALFDDPAIENLSVLRPGFRETARIIKRGETAVDYDAWLSERRPAHASR